MKEGRAGAHSVTVGSPSPVTAPLGACWAAVIRALSAPRDVSWPLGGEQCPVSARGAAASMAEAAARSVAALHCWGF